MKLKDWIELSAIAGELEGLALGVRNFKDLSTEKLAEALEEISKKVLVVKQNTMSEVEEIRNAPTHTQNNSKNGHILSNTPDKEEHH